MYIVNKQSKLKKRAGEQPLDPTLIGLNLESKSQEQIDFEIAQSKIVYNERQAKVKKEFIEWVNSKREIPGSIPHLDYVIVEIFHYKESSITEGGIILETEEGELQDMLKIYPIVKILKGTYESEFALIAPNKTKTVKSREWEMWLKDVTEQPSLKHSIPEPPRYIGKLLEWADYMIQSNPLEENSNLDHYTFCIPTRFLQLNLTKNDVLTYIN